MWVVFILFRSRRFCDFGTLSHLADRKKEQTTTRELYSHTHIIVAKAVHNIVGTAKTITKLSLSKTSSEKVSYAVHSKRGEGK